MAEFYPEGWLIDTVGNRLSMQNPATLAQASHEEKILEARALVCDGEHNLIVDLGCMKGIIKREDGALGIREGVVRDIAVYEAKKGIVTEEVPEKTVMSGIPARPYCKGRNYDPNRYSKTEE